MSSRAYLSPWVGDETFGDRMLLLGKKECVFAFLEGFSQQRMLGTATLFSCVFPVGRSHQLPKQYNRLLSHVLVQHLTLNKYFYLITQRQ